MSDNTASSSSPQLESTMFSSLDISNLKIGDDVSSLSAAEASFTLQKFLPLQTVLSPKIREAINQQEPTSSTAPFRSIGKGFCGEIYEKTGTNRIFKRELPQGVKKLWNDFIWHTSVYDEMLRANIEYENVRSVDTHLPLLQVPKVFSYITPQNPTWWISNPSFPTIAPREPSNLLEAELIPALPYVVRKALIARYCPHDKVSALKDPTNENCLARIYLGVRRPTRSKTAGFTLRNFELDLQILDELGLEKEYLAREMARALAVCHWRCRTDANDVEFTLASSPTSPIPLTTPEIATLSPNTDTSSSISAKIRTSHIWLLDFNNCSAITMDKAGVQKASKAFWDNDPYYPRPKPDEDQDEALWRVFKDTYLDFSRTFEEGDVWERGLPGMFIDTVVREAKRRPEGLGASIGPPVTLGAPPHVRNTRDKKKGRQYPDLLPIS
ncbi:zinc finger protein-domain-containing protein [Rhexocercosporidium sp. MPI-PUGE-AT-0058]|nr:zinc finger protein-domain-containing protein [Rhexocercosporidium sp. MPI-PUGE-AT-0058]